MHIHTAALLTLLVVPTLAPLLRAPRSQTSVPTPLGRWDSRTPIRSLPCEIDQPGSYVVLRDLQPNPSDPRGIEVSVDFVTIDLNGFTLDGSGGAGSGIRATAPVEGLTIRNGNVVDWPAHGIDAASVLQCHLEGLRAVRNGATGFTAGEGALVQGCSTHANSAAGFALPYSAVIERCSATSNAVDYELGYLCIMERCRSNGGATGARLIGFGNQVYRSSFRGSSEALLVEAGMSTIASNVVAQNAVAGIHVLGALQNNRIDGNHVSMSGRGFWVEAALPSAPTVLIRNSAALNATNYDLDPSCDSGPIGTATASTSPWANIEH